MTAKIIVADDSTTIQKVVRITLAAEPVEIVECLTDDKLIEVARGNDFDLLLLDFNLSESKSGYQLASELRANGVQAPIVAMLGTFDSVDESELSKAGIDDRIIKPFESDIFIQKCRELIEKGRPEVEGTIPAESFSEAREEIQIPEDADWVVNSPEIDFGAATDGPDDSDLDLNTQGNALGKELEGWGMEIPGVIGAGDADLPAADTLDIPPVIGSLSSDDLGSIEMRQMDDLVIDESVDEDVNFDVDATSKFNLTEFENTYDQSLPQDDDLAYPSSEIAEEEKSSEFDFSDMDSSPVSIDELNLQEEDELVDEFAPVIDEEKSEALEMELEEELGDDDIWAIDDELTEGPNAPKDEQIASVEVDDLLAEESEVPFDDDLDFGPELELNIKEKSPAADFQINSEEIVEKLMASITPLVEEMIKKHCKEAVERVAWEVIPDLAENLIKKEIKDISDSL